MLVNLLLAHSMLSLALLGTKPHGARKRFTNIYLHFYLIARLYYFELTNSLVHIFIYVKYTR